MPNEIFLRKGHGNTKIQYFQDPHQKTAFRQHEDDHAESDGMFELRKPDSDAPGLSEVRLLSWEASV